MADDSRLSRAGPRHRRRDRTFGDRPRTGPARLSEDQAQNARSHAAARGGAHAVPCLSPALAGRIGLDDRASVFLQRDLLYLCAGLDRLLRHRSEPDRLVHPPLRGWPFPWAAGAPPAGRYARTPRDDYAHLWRIGRSARAFGLSVFDRRVERADPDYRMDGNLFFRFSGGERGISYRQRNLSAGGPCARDRGVLLDRNGNRWRRRSRFVGCL